MEFFQPGYDEEGTGIRAVLQFKGKEIETSSQYVKNEEGIGYVIDTTGHDVLIRKNEL